MAGEREMLRVRAADPGRPVHIVDGDGHALRRQVIKVGGVERDLSKIGAAVQEVPNLRYYRQRIAAGDLVLVPTADKADKE